MKKIFTLLFLIFFRLTTYSQSLTIQDGTIFIQEGGLLYLEDSTSSAILRTGGGILMEGKNSTFEWKISDTDVGEFTVPFIDTADTYLPVSLKFNNTTPISTIKFSTWYDSDVSTEEPIVFITTHSQALNQFWRIEGLNKETEVTLFYNQVDVNNNGLDEGLLVPIRWNSDVTNWYDKTYTSSVDIDSNSVTFNSITSDDFYTFWALQESGAVGLPVKLIYFKSNCNIKTVSWVTATEINNDYFVLEGSNNGLVWSNIGKITGGGNVSVDTYYEYDVSESPWNYYRLKQVDYDGAFEYSNIITGCNSSKVTEIKLFPNPNDGRFLITHDSEYKFEVYDILGKMVWSKTTNQVNFDLRELSLGEYVIKMNNSEKIMNFRFVKIL